jgi:N-methylhydantoinase A
LGSWQEAVRPLVPQGTVGAATTTDANLLLGRLASDQFLGGAMALNPVEAHRALLALNPGLDEAKVPAAAWDIIQLANATMERAIRRVSVERGYDPRRFTLLAFGGAGPLHACDLADSLAIPQVLIPAAPGVLSALGMVAAQPRRDYSRTVMRRFGPGELVDEVWLAAQFEPLEERASAEMDAEGHDPARLVVERLADIRYAGQSHELTIPLPSRDPGAVAAVLFHQAHQARYGYAQANAAVELVTLRLQAVAAVPPLLMARRPAATTPIEAAEMGHRRVWFGPEDERLIPAFNRDRLAPGHRLTGPAVIYQYDTTTVISPGWLAEVDSYGNLLLRRGE